MKGKAKIPLFVRLGGFFYAFFIKMGGFLRFWRKTTIGKTNCDKIINKKNDTSQKHQYRKTNKNIRKNANKKSGRTVR